MKILVLEDKRERIDFFKQHYQREEDQLVIASDVEIALNLLDNYDFGLIFIDQDLGNDENGISRGRGAQVVAYLTEPHISPNAIIVIHSSNMVDGPQMERALRNAKRLAWHLPFHIFSAKLKDEKVWEADIESWRRSTEQHGWEK